MVHKSRNFTICPRRACHLMMSLLYAINFNCKLIPAAFDCKLIAGVGQMWSVDQFARTNQSEGRIRTIINTFICDHNDTTNPSFFLFFCKLPVLKNKMNLISIMWGHYQWIKCLTEWVVSVLLSCVTFRRLSVVISSIDGYVAVFVLDADSQTYTQAHSESQWHVLPLQHLIFHISLSLSPFSIYLPPVWHVFFVVQFPSLSAALVPTSSSSSLPPSPTTTTTTIGFRSPDSPPLRSGHLCWFTVKSSRIISNPTAVKSVCWQLCSLWQCCCFLPYIPEKKACLPPQKRKKNTLIFHLNGFQLTIFYSLFLWYFSIFDCNVGLRYAYVD